MGDASYPRGFLSILQKAGLELVILYHMSVNSPYFDKSNPYGPYYAHGGIDETTGEFRVEEPNFYGFGSTSSDSLRIVHAYLEESRFISHLVNVGCIADNSQYSFIPAVLDRKNVQLSWQEELQRWLATQLSSRHPNHEHVTLLWNVQSQQCESLEAAFAAAADLLKLPLTQVETTALWGWRGRFMVE